MSGPGRALTLWTARNRGPKDQREFRPQGQALQFDANPKSHSEVLGSTAVMAQMSGLFLIAAIVIGIVGRLGEARLVEAFVNGARDLLGVALIIGLARGIVNLHHPSMRHARLRVNFSTEIDEQCLGFLTIIKGLRYKRQNNLSCFCAAILCFQKIGQLRNLSLFPL